MSGAGRISLVSALTITTNWRGIRGKPTSTREGSAAGSAVEAVEGGVGVRAGRGGDEAERDGHESKSSDAIHSGAQAHSDRG